MMTEQTMTGQLPPPGADVSFEEAYELYGKRILNALHRLTGSEDAARDLTQEVFVKVYENMDTFKKQSSLYTWIYRIAINHALNFLKRERRYRWLDVLDLKISDVLQTEKIDTPYWQSGTANPEQKLEKKQREAILWKELQKLTPKYRLPFQLHRYEEMSYKEIAEIMDLSLSAVEARIHRARKMLVKALEPLRGQI